MTYRQEQINKLKEKYHCKFRKNINHNKNYIKQLLERAFTEYNNHVAFNPYIRINGANSKDQIELIALNELIKTYQSIIGFEKVKYESC